MTLHPAPAYCDVAFMKLVKRLREQVKAYNPEKVFFASDTQGASNLFESDTPGVVTGGNVAGYAIVADGTYQYSQCNPVLWAHGLFVSVNSSTSRRKRHKGRSFHGDDLDDDP